MSSLSPQEEDVFCEALNRADRVARGAFLDQVCAGNLEFRRRIEQLLAAQAEADGYAFQLDIGIGFTQRVFEFDA